MPVPGWLYYVRVPDVKEAVEAAKREGGKVLNGPMEVLGGDLVAQCLDPQGAAFALHSTAE
jgi:predicted enzyme related to lactoylglutathione lyase